MYFSFYFQFDFEKLNIKQLQNQQKKSEPPFIIYHHELISKINWNHSIEKWNEKNSLIS